MASLTEWIKTAPVQELKELQDVLIRDVAEPSRYCDRDEAKQKLRIVTAELMGRQKLIKAA